MGGCQNYGPFLDPYYNTAPNIEGTQKSDHNFDNHTYEYITPRMENLTNHQKRNEMEPGRFGGSYKRYLVYG